MTDQEEKLIMLTSEELSTDNIIQWLNAMGKHRNILSIVDLCNRTHMETMRRITMEEFIVIKMPCALLS